MKRASTAVAALALLVACESRRPVPLDARVVPRDGAARPACGAPGSSADGGRCRCASDCAEGAICVDEETSRVAGGVCIRFCSDDPAVCGAGTRCEDVEGSGAPICTRTCAVLEDCPAGRLCAEGLCIHRCLGDADCESGLCDLPSGDCHRGELGGGLPALAPCTRHEECRSTLCLGPYGRCIAPCSIARQSCLPGEACVFDGPIDRDQGACLPRCERDADCGDPALVCDLVARPGATELVCIPTAWGGR